MGRTAKPQLLVLHGLGAARADELVPRLSPIAEVSVIYCDRLQHSAAEGRFLDGYDGSVRISNLDHLVDAALEHASAHPPAGVLTFSEPMMELAAHIAGVLELPGHPVEAAARMHRKDLQRTALAEAGVPVPNFQILSDPSDLESGLDGVRFPAILKPAVAAGSILAVPVGDLGELADQYAFARDAYANVHFMFPEAPRFVVEELLVGSNWHDDERMGDYVSVESLVLAGRPLHLTVTDKFPLQHPFRETGDLMPSTLSGARRDEILAVTDAALDALGAYQGATHVELKLTPAGPRVIEVNGRLGGGVAALLSASASYDAFTETARVALGQTPSTPTFSRYATLVLPTAPATEPARVAELDGFEAVAEWPEVLRAAQSVHARDSFDWRLGQGRLGEVLAAAEDPETLRSMPLRVERALTLRVSAAAARTR